MPTIVLPDGTIMTETAAIVIHLDETVPEAGLLPRPDQPERRAALRWLLFLVSAVYPTFTYGDDTARWVGDAGAVLRASTEDHRKRLWLQIESQVGAPR